MNNDATSIESRVTRIVAESLDVDPARVRLHSSLTDDLGAESIDFLDILFRVESEFDLIIEENDLWRGSIDSDDPAAVRAGVEQLKARMPEFDWNRLPATLTRADLPRLISVRTIVDYVSHRLASGDGTAPRAGG